MTDETMEAVSHTHPHTGETFGAVYRRVPAVADGGERPTEGEADEMKDVDHTPPHGDGANDVWERGRGRGEDADGHVERVVEVSDE
ncbi:hypothetical protein ACFQJD_08545 [Haloplanus sp. GCM10025708]|uniref:hypothetical protein n=1 Tax=Haloferacaceae TaxID=1644056 RepID=UPI003619AB5A